jgi:amino acid transporter
MKTFFDVESYTFGTLLIVLFVLASVGGVFIVRKHPFLDRLRPYHDVSGNIFSVAGTLYAVLLGLVVVDAMQTFQTARLTVERESEALSNLFMMAHRLPEEQAHRIEKLCASYAREVSEQEWPLMTEGKVLETSRTLTRDLLQAIAGIEPDTDNLKAIYPVMLEQSVELRNQRRMRTSLATYDLPAIEWVVLCAGAVMTVVFTYLFRLDSLRVQVIMTGMIALLIALNLYLVVLFARPFSGDLHIDPGPFLTDLRIFEEAGTPPP